MKTNRPVLFSADQLVQPDGAFLSYITVPIATKWCYKLNKKYDGAIIANAWAPYIKLDFPTEFVENMNAEYLLSSLANDWEWRKWFQVNWNHGHPNKFVHTGFPSVCLRKHVIAKGDISWLWARLKRALPYDLKHSTMLQS